MRVVFGEIVEGGTTRPRRPAAGDHPLTNFGTVERVTSEVSSRERERDECALRPL